MNEIEQELLMNFRKLPIPAQADLISRSAFAVTAWKLAMETAEKTIHGIRTGNNLDRQSGVRREK
ncbi:hypothetical protein FACS1894172_19910 [Spirochaetia bacterium]|nr:hypothetical protein FACS1894172_19910 [Spirochaetia bacterium]